MTGRLTTAWACLASCCLALSACAGGASAVKEPAASTASTVSTKAPRPTTASSRSTPTPTPTPEPPTPATPSGTITLAFGGDANAFSRGGASTTLGLGEAGDLLASADFAVVNLETALAASDKGLVGQQKRYHFLTDSAFPEMLQREGVDLVSLANNHAMDFGVPGLERTLAVRDASDLPMIGVGRTTSEAFAPWTGTVSGRRLSVFVGNDILEPQLDWRPRDGQPGVAMIKTAKGLAALVDGVREARDADPNRVIVVYVHWGIDYSVCTSSRQHEVAQALADAGATVVVGTHAHRVQRTTLVGDTLVAYGLGNFNFFSDRTVTRETGVLTVTIPRTGAPSYDWTPGVIVDGRPVLLTGDERDAALARYATLPRC